MQNRQIEISFLDVNKKMASEFREELQLHIQHNAPDVEILVKRADEDALDPGSILVLILSSELAIEVAKAIVKGIFDWLKHRNTIKLKIEANGKSIEIEYHKGMSQEELAILIEQAANA